MNADKYIFILKNYLLPIYNGNYIFQHDNDPKHTALKTSLFLIDNNIKVLLWAPNSPDLNPIENIWKLLKDKLGKENITDYLLENPETYREIEKNVVETILETWAEIEHQDFQIENEDEDLIF